MGSLFSNLSAEGQAILMCLAALTGTAVLRLMWAWLCTTDEADAISLFENKPPKSQADLDAHLKTLSEKKPLGASLETLLLLRASLESGQVQARWKRLYQDATWPSYLAGVFVFIGLLGTVLGISVGIANLSETLNASKSGEVTASVTRPLNSNKPSGAARSLNSTMNASQFQEQAQRLNTGIVTLLGSIQSASVCTLGGIAATLVVSFLNMRYLGRCRNLERRLSHVVETQVLPFSLHHRRSEQEDGMLRQALSVADKMAAASTSLQKILTSLDTERTGLDAASISVRTAAAGMTQEVRTLREAFADLKQHQTTQQDTLIASYQKNQEALRDLLRRFEAVLNDVAAVAEDSPLRQQIMELRSDLLDANGNSGGKSGLRGGTRPASTPSRIPHSDGAEARNFQDFAIVPGGAGVLQTRGRRADEEEPLLARWWGKIRGVFSRKSGTEE